jgi:hypothetical protein
MFGTLSKIDITDELIVNVARKQFDGLNDCKYDDQRGDIRGDWEKAACDDLESFNDIVKIFKEIHQECEVNVHGCGHDTGEYYKE